MIMKLILDGRTFEDVKEPVIAFCNNYTMTDIEDLDKRNHFCNGTVSIQGPHVNTSEHILFIRLFKILPICKQTY